MRRSYLVLCICIHSSTWTSERQKSSKIPERYFRYIMLCGISQSYPEINEKWHRLNKTFNIQYMMNIGKLLCMLSSQPCQHALKTSNFLRELILLLLYVLGSFHQVFTRFSPHYSTTLFVLYISHGTLSNMPESCMLCPAWKRRFFIFSLSRSNLCWPILCLLSSDELWPTQGQ